MFTQQYVDFFFSAMFILILPKIADTLLDSSTEIEFTDSD